MDYRPLNSTGECAHVVLPSTRCRLWKDSTRSCPSIGPSYRQVVVSPGRTYWTLAV
ncbi:hypothetical protein BS47DRAFT_1349104 [Hydnum rufescens UP504]|uniref:Uncharacterized protein n=1 Tax=Hydnum rufescens UP504 TaxID=1448309 RepID=A0A9P6DP16_9AGAM|nr:hypothetical protein BS47DRAFT_1349020 [Hydnum rufescens UP504]KAF9509556.1 hypothetical protein BS47DRAFT_1349104 [Hydnum rufescens UP504]